MSLIPTYMMYPESKSEIANIPISPTYLFLPTLFFPCLSLTSLSNRPMSKKPCPNQPHE